MVAYLELLSVFRASLLRASFCRSVGRWALRLSARQVYARRRRPRFIFGSVCVCVW